MHYFKKHILFLFVFASFLVGFKSTAITFAELVGITYSRLLLVFTESLRTPSTLFGGVNTGAETFLPFNPMSSVHCMKPTPTLPTAPQQAYSLHISLLALNLEIENGITEENSILNKN